MVVAHCDWRQGLPGHCYKRRQGAATPNWDGILERVCRGANQTRIADGGSDQARDGTRRRVAARSDAALLPLLLEREKREGGVEEGVFLRTSAGWTAP